MPLKKKENIYIKNDPTTRKTKKQDKIRTFVRAASSIGVISFLLARRRPINDAVKRRQSTADVQPHTERSQTTSWLESATARERKVVMFSS